MDEHTPNLLCVCGVYGDHCGLDANDLRNVVEFMTAT